jgi:hypothetical protein
VPESFERSWRRTVANAIRVVRIGKTEDTLQGIIDQISEATQTELKLYQDIDGLEIVKFRVGKRDLGGHLKTLGLCEWKSEWASFRKVPALAKAET